MKTIKKLVSSRSGFTLVEMLIAMLIMAIFFLSLHFISRIAIATPRQHEREMKIASDAGYGLKLMQKHVREAENVLDPDTPGSPWMGERLVIDPLGPGANMAFGVYNNAGANRIELFYADDESADITDVNNRHVLLSIPGSWSITFNPNVTGNKVMDAQIQVRDDNNRLIYDVSTKAVRRI